MKKLTRFSSYDNAVLLKYNFLAHYTSLLFFFLFSPLFIYFFLEMNEV